MPSNEIDILKLWGANLRRIRRDKGYSQRELSSRCNIDNADISRMENGEINVTLRTIRQLAEALDVRIIDMMMNLQP